MAPGGGLLGLPPGAGHAHIVCLCVVHRLRSQDSPSPAMRMPLDSIFSSLALYGPRLSPAPFTSCTTQQNDRSRPSRPAYTLGLRVRCPTRGG